MLYEIFRVTQCLRNRSKKYLFMFGKSSIRL